MAFELPDKPSIAVLPFVNMSDDSEQEYFAIGLAQVTGLPVVPLMLAFSPGGLAEMSLIAIAIGADAAFVATHHIVRIFLVIVIAPLAFKLMRRRREGS